MHLYQIQFMLYHEKEGKNKENANSFHIVYFLAKLCNIFDEAFFIDVSIGIIINTFITKMQYTEIFGGCKNENFHLKKFDTFLIFAQNIEADLTSTHNLCFGSKIRKIGLPLHTPVLLYKSGA